MIYRISANEGSVVWLQRAMAERTKSGPLSLQFQFVLDLRFQLVLHDAACAGVPAQQYLVLSRWPYGLTFSNQGFASRRNLVRLVSESR